MSEQDTPPSSPVRESNGHFAKGNPGGPGRPRSVGRGAAALDAIGTEVGEAVVRVIVEKALAGDLRAAEMVLSRAWPHRPGRQIEVAAPPLETISGYVPAAAAVAQAVMDGTVTSAEGRALSQVLDTQCRTIETVEQQRKLEDLQEEMGAFKRALQGK
jgi:hypothetical protein